METRVIEADTFVAWRSSAPWSSWTRKHTWLALKGPTHNSKPLWTPWCVEIHDFPPVAGHRHLCFIYLVRTFSTEYRVQYSELLGAKWFNDLALQSMGSNVLLETTRFYAREAISLTKNITS